MNPGPSCDHHWGPSDKPWTLWCDHCPQEQFRNDLRLALRGNGCEFCAAGNMWHITLAYYGIRAT
jgi:hypothetical protein